MTVEVDLTPEEKNVANTQPIRLILGLIFLVPAGLCCLTSLVWPTLETFRISFQKVNLLRAENEFVGLANYTHLFQDETFLQVLNFSLSLVGSRLVVVAVVPLLLALIVNEFGWTTRRLVRLLFTIPLALFAPVIVALTWSMALQPNVGLLEQTQPWLADPNRAGWAIRFIDGLYTFGLACGLGLIFYLAALRGWDQTSPFWLKSAKPLIITWIIGLLATVAITLQAFTLSFVMTAGGPARATTTLTIWQYTQAFQFFNFGQAAAIASLILTILMLLGLAVGLIVILLGLRFQTEPLQEPGRLFPGIGQPVIGGLLVLLLLGALGVGIVATLPLGWNALNSFKSAEEIFASTASFWPASPSSDAYLQLGEAIPIGRVLFNTLWPPLLALFFYQLPAAYLAALSIGGLRPLGRWSEWLLLPFSPWLFVTIGPLAIHAFQRWRDLELLNTESGLISPLLLNVPMLIILTLFFKGQEAKFQTALVEGRSWVSALFGQLILPSLPLTVLLASGALLIGWQELLWPLVVATSLEHQSLTVALLSLRQQFQTSWPLLAAGLTLFELPIFLFFLLIFGLLQILYLDRLVLRVESSTS